MRCRVYWRDDVDGEGELAREPDTLPGTCQNKGQRSRLEVKDPIQQVTFLTEIVRFQTPRPTGRDGFIGD